MTMPSSGPLNMGGTTSPQSVANELGLGLTTTISMNQAAVRTLAGVGGSGTQWSMSSLYGKSAITVSLASISSQGTFTAESYTVGEPATAEIAFNTNGTWYFYGEAAGDLSGNWATPTTAGVGTGYWIQWTRTYFSGGFGSSATPTSGWQQLNDVRFISVGNTGAITQVSAQYTINIATDSAGANVIATAPLISFYAFSNIA